MSQQIELSVVVPVYNEAVGLATFHSSLVPAIEAAAGQNYEIIYVNDGSSDNSAEVLKELHGTNHKVRILTLSRNFGKESALSAGIAAANGKAVLTLDADGQHPVELIKSFVEAWKSGAQVVVGVGQYPGGTSTKQIGSSLFHKLYNSVSRQPLLHGSTDFRLLDQEVAKAFGQMTETERINRGLIDWLGFNRQYIYFKFNDRLAGKQTFSYKQRFSLAANSFVSLSPRPLYLFGYLGVLITLGSLLLGLSVLFEQLIAGDPWHWHFTGTAMLGILILFMVGLVLMSQGILSLYISHIHSQSKGRPLYVINRAESLGFDKHVD